MSWNYRVIRYKDSPEGKPESFCFEVHEVFYSEEGRPNGWSERATILIDEDLKSLCADWRLIEEAFKLPVLEIKGDKLEEIK